MASRKTSNKQAYSARQGYKKSSSPSQSCGSCSPEQEVVILEKECKHSQILPQENGNYLHISGSGATQVIDVDPGISLVENQDGTWTFDWEGAAEPVTIDPCAAVANNCNATIKFNSDGSFTFTDNAGNEILVPPAPASQFNISETGLLTHIAGDGTVATFDLCDIVAGNCSDSFVAQPDGSFIHTSISGETVVLPAPPVATLTPGADGTYIFDNGAGQTQVIDVNAFDMDIDDVSLQGSTLIFHSEDGGEIRYDVCDIVATRCNASLAGQSDGSLLFTDNAGNEHVIPAATAATIFDNDNGSFTFVGSDGAAVILDICKILEDGGCLPPSSSVTDNGDGTYTHQGGDGVVTIIDVRPDPVSLTDLGDGTFEFDNGQGATSIIDICQTVAANCGASLAPNGDGSWTFTDNAGQSTTLPAPPSDSLVHSGQGVYVHTSAAGLATTIDICGIINQYCPPLSSSIAPGPDGSFIFTAADGEVTVIDFDDAPANAVHNGNDWLDQTGSIIGPPVSDTNGSPIDPTETYIVTALGWCPKGSTDCAAVEACMAPTIAGLNQRINNSEVTGGTTGPWTVTDTDGDTITIPAATAETCQPLPAGTIDYCLAPDWAAMNAQALAVVNAGDPGTFWSDEATGGLWFKAADGTVCTLQMPELTHRCGWGFIQSDPLSWSFEGGDWIATSDSGAVTRLRSTNWAGNGTSTSFIGPGETIHISVTLETLPNVMTEFGCRRRYVWHGWFASLDPNLTATVSGHWQQGDSLPGSAARPLTEVGLVGAWPEYEGAAFNSGRLTIKSIDALTGDNLTAVIKSDDPALQSFSHSSSVFYWDPYDIWLDASGNRACVRNLAGDSVDVAEPIITEDSHPLPAPQPAPTAVVTNGDATSIAGIPVYKPLQPRAHYAHAPNVATLSGPDLAIGDIMQQTSLATFTIVDVPRRIEVHTKDGQMVRGRLRVNAATEYRIDGGAWVRLPMAGTDVYANNIVVDEVGEITHTNRGVTAILAPGSHTIEARVRIISLEYVSAGSSITRHRFSLQALILEPTS